MKTLYHYTSIERWELIEADGRINTTESNLNLNTPHAGPDVVWLTIDPDCVHGHGLHHSLDGTDKARVQIVVELPNRDVYKWREWAERRRMDPDWMRQFINAAGGVCGHLACDQEADTVHALGQCRRQTNRRDTLAVTARFTEIRLNTG